MLIIMSELEAYIDSTTSRLLSKLSQAIDETQLVRSINNLEENIYKIESVNGPTPRSKFLRNEINQLERKLYQLRHHPA